MLKTNKVMSCSVAPLQGCRHICCRVAAENSNQWLHFKCWSNGVDISDIYNEIFELIWYLSFKHSLLKVLFGHGRSPSVMVVKGNRLTHNDQTILSCFFISWLFLYFPSSIIHVNLLPFPYFENILSCNYHTCYVHSGDQGCLHFSSQGRNNT